MSSSDLVYHEGVYCPRCKKYVATIIVAKPVYIEVVHQNCDFRVDLQEYIRYYLEKIIKKEFSLYFEEYAFDKILFLATDEVNMVGDAFAEIQKRTNHFFQKVVLYSDSPQRHCPLCDNGYFESRPERPISEGQCEKGHFVFNKDKYLLKILRESGHRYQEIKGESAYNIFAPRFLSSVKVARITLGYSKDNHLRTLQVSQMTTNYDYYTSLINTLSSFSIPQLFEITKF